MRLLVSWGISLAFAGTVGIAIAIIALPAGSSVPATATSPDVTVSESGDDASCARSGPPCASLGRAYQIAVPGDTISVAAGTYGAETVTADTPKDGPPITVEAAGATFGALTLAGVRHLVIDGIRVEGVFNFRPFPLLGTTSDAATLTEDVAVVNAELRVFNLRNVRNFSLRDSRVGGQNVSTSGLGVPKLGGYPSTPYRPSAGILLERVEFHDIIRTEPDGTHAECLFVDGGTDGLTIRDSSFTNCGVFDVFGGPSSAGPIANVTLEGNRLDVPRDTTGSAAPSAINLKGGAASVMIRRNSILGNVRIDEAAYPGLRLERNAIGNTDCSFAPDSAWVGNVMTASCGGNVQAEPGFVSASRADCDLSNCFRNDLRVTAESAAAAAGAGVPLLSPPSGPVDGTPATPAPGTPPPAATRACDNGLDDDNDGKIDLADPGCTSHADTDETDPGTPPTTPPVTTPPVTSPPPAAPPPAEPPVTTPAPPAHAAAPAGAAGNAPAISSPAAPAATGETARVRTDVVLGPGDSGDAVRDLQRALDVLGYAPGEADGTYGVRTTLAVIAFQRDAGLAVDGIAGEQTLTAINAALVGS